GLWFTEFTLDCESLPCSLISRQVFRITTDGQITAVTDQDTFGGRLALGQDGNIWFPEDLSIGRFHVPDQAPVLTVAPSSQLFSGDPAFGTNGMVSNTLMNTDGSPTEEHLDANIHNGVIQLPDRRMVALTPGFDSTTYHPIVLRRYLTDDSPDPTF